MLHAQAMFDMFQVATAWDIPALLANAFNPFRIDVSRRCVGTQGGRKQYKRVNENLHYEDVGNSCFLADDA